MVGNFLCLGVLVKVKDNLALVNIPTDAGSTCMKTPHCISLTNISGHQS